MKQHLTKLVTVGVMAAAMAFAQTTPSAAPAPAPGQHARLQRRMLKDLNLTAAQKQQSKAIFQSTRQQAQPVAQQLKQQRQALTAAVQANDTTRIQQISTQVGSLQGQVLAIRSAGKAQFFALLTPEQKAKAGDALGAKGE